MAHRDPTCSREQHRGGAPTCDGEHGAPDDQTGGAAEDLSAYVRDVEGFISVLQSLCASSYVAPDVLKTCGLGETYVDESVARALLQQLASVNTLDDDLKPEAWAGQYFKWRRSSITDSENDVDDDHDGAPGPVVERSAESVDIVNWISCVRGCQKPTKAELERWMACIGALGFDTQVIDDDGCNQIAGLAIDAALSGREGMQSACPQSQAIHSATPPPRPPLTTAAAKLVSLPALTCSSTSKSLRSWSVDRSRTLASPSTQGALTTCVATVMRQGSAWQRPREVLVVRRL